MPQLMDHGDRVDELVRATIHLINTEGIGSFTLRKIAAVARVSPSSVTAHLENKRRLTDLVMKGIAVRLDRELSYGVRRQGVIAFVPGDTVLPLVRAWLAMCELARGDDELAIAVAYRENEQRYLVQWGCRLAPGDIVTLVTMHALIGGLWTAMCARSDPMTPEQAEAALRHACAVFGVPVDPEDD
jgi:AcrR family transcriptional regulator